MTGLHLDIYKFLVDHCSGIECALPRATILARFNLIKHKELSDRVFRAVVADLVTDFKKAICTTSDDGYYVARTEKEKFPALNYLDAVIGKIAKRRRDLAEAEPLEKQERLF